MIELVPGQINLNWFNVTLFILAVVAHQKMVERLSLLREYGCYSTLGKLNE